MCTVGAVINARVARVTYAQEDDQTGTLDRARLQGLPPLWPRAAREQGLEVVACQGERPAERDSYVPPDLLAALGEVFLVNREPLDRMLEREGFFRPAELLADLPVSAR